MDPADVPLPPEVAVDEPPLSDADLESLFGAFDKVEAEAPLKQSEAIASVLYLGGDSGDAEVERVRRWRPTDDGSAEWVAGKWAQAKATHDEAVEQAAAWSARVSRWLDGRLRRPKATMAWAEALLEGLALERREASDGKAKTLTLPSATVSTTGHKAKAVVVKPDEFVAWALEEAPELLSHSVKLRELAAAVEVTERVVGWDRFVTFECGHERTTFVVGADEPAPLAVGELLGCYECTEGGDPLLQRVVTDSRDEPRVEPTVVLPATGEVVPGADVEPESTSASVRAV